MFKRKNSVSSNAILKQDSSSPECFPFLERLWPSRLMLTFLDPQRSSSFPFLSYYWQQQNFAVSQFNQLKGARTKTNINNYHLLVYSSLCHDIFIITYVQKFMFTRTDSIVKSQPHSSSLRKKKKQQEPSWANWTLSWRRVRAKITLHSYLV